MSSELSHAIVDETMRNLVRQFSQELCFYRELIQNSLDAGSRRIDVQVEYDTERGMAIAHVVDYGEGMDRKVIDEQLTRLFSSSKENDFTKIGKFGIGFVSVFAIEPQAVVVDTGKGGEHWRVLFKPNGEFDRIQLDEPIEGTHVKVYKVMPRSEFDKFRQRSLQTVKYWCRHADVEIRFDGEVVNEALDLEAPIKVHCAEHGTEVVAALSSDKDPFFGFYNGGITLLEGRKAWVDGIAFKMKSRYLEHTLTRDNVKQDQNFGKAMHVLGHAVEQDLMAEMFRVLATAAASAEPTVYQHTLRLCEPRLRAHWLTSDNPPAARRLQGHWSTSGYHAPVVRRLQGPPLSYADLESQRGRTSTLLQNLGAAPGHYLLFDDSPNALTEQLQKFGVAVLCAEVVPFLPQQFQATRASELLTCLPPPALHIEPPVRGEGPPRAEPSPASPHSSPLVPQAPSPASHVVPQAPSPASPDILQLGTAAVRLLARCGVQVKGPSWSNFEYPSSPLGQRLFVLQKEPGPLVLCQQEPLLSGDGQPPSWLGAMLGRPPHLVLNLAHPLLIRLAREYAARADLATYLLAKAICVHRGVHPELEQRLLEHSIPHA